MKWTGICSFLFKEVPVVTIDVGFPWFADFLVSQSIVDESD